MIWIVKFHFGREFIVILRTQSGVRKAAYAKRIIIMPLWLKLKLLSCFIELYEPSFDI